MDKNILLGIVMALAIGVVGVLFSFSPKENIQVIKSTSEISQKMKQNNNIDVVYHGKSQKSTQIEQHTQKKSSKKIDPTIKAATIDHYNNYLIQLIDENPEDKDLKLENEPGTYMYIEGKVNGKQYVLKVPKSVLDRPGIKIRVTDLKTKKITEIDASFLSEAVSLPVDSTFKADIDTNNPENVRTTVELPEENPPFPTLRE